MRACPSCGEDNAEKAKFCAECGTPLGVRGDRAQRKLDIALFCDVVGSTALGEIHDPEVLRLDDLADAYRRKGNLVALRRTEDRIAALKGT